MEKLNTMWIILTLLMCGIFLIADVHALDENITSCSIDWNEEKSFYYAEDILNLNINTDGNIEELDYWMDFNFWNDSFEYDINSNYNTNIDINYPILEPSFETIENWAYSESDPSGTMSGNQSTSHVTDGVKSYRLLKGTDTSTNGNYARISQNINFDNIDWIYFDYYYVNQDSDVHFIVKIGSSTLFDLTSNSSSDINYDCSSINGVQTLSFTLILTGNAYNSCWADIDNLIVNGDYNIETTSWYNFVDDGIISKKANLNIIDSNSETIENFNLYLTDKENNNKYIYNDTNYIDLKDFLNYEDINKSFSILIESDNMQSKIYENYDVNSETNDINLTMANNSITLRFSSNTNGTIYDSQQAFTFNTTDEISYYTNEFDDGKILITFNDNSQFYEFVNYSEYSIDENLFVYDVNSDDMKLISTGTKEIYGVAIQNAIIKDFVLDANIWNLVGQRITDVEGLTQFYTKENTYHYVVGSKNEYDDDYYLGDIINFFDTTNIIWLYLIQNLYSYNENYRFYTKEYFDVNAGGYSYFEEDQNVNIVLNTIYNNDSITIREYKNDVLQNTYSSTEDYLQKTIEISANNNYKFEAYINDELQEVVINLYGSNIITEIVANIETDDLIPMDSEKDSTLFIVFILAIIIISAIAEYYISKGMFVFLILTIIVSIWEGNMLVLMGISVLYFAIQIIKKLFGSD